MELSKQLKQKYNIATDRSLLIPFIKIDKERIITSTEALKLKEPKHLVIMVVGVELN
jgi:dihydrolipoamide dehydrogenase